MVLERTYLEDSILIPKWGYKLKLSEMKHKTYQERGKFGRTFKTDIKNLKMKLGMEKQQRVTKLAVMNVELLKSKIQSYFSSTTAEQIVAEFSKLGYTFIENDVE